MPESDFLKVLGKYVTDRTMDCEEYESMGYQMMNQKAIIQELKRAFKRLKAQHDRQNKSMV